MDFYILDHNAPIRLPKQADQALVCELLNGYAGNNDWNIQISETENIITIGRTEDTALDGYAFVLRVAPSGIFIRGKDFSSLMNGFTMFLEKIKFDCRKRQIGTRPDRVVPCGVFRSQPNLNFRIAHLCVFPDDTLEFLQKSVRACGMVQYTHIILEFWGMLQFDCMKELSWPFAYTKEQLRPILREANDLGMEVIPMFNHYGHASGCREVNGKHVVLNQNPDYGYLFDDHGWIWNTAEPEVSELHRKIRKELIELCGAGHYFHIGCDEAYRMGSEPEMARKFCNYVNAVQKEMNEVGRRCIIWGDMLLGKEQLCRESQHYSVNSTEEVAILLRQNLDKNIIIADWQYDITEGTWKSVQPLKEAGFDIICCSWHKYKNIDSAIQTVLDEKLYGYMHTTWQNLYKYFPAMLYAGKSAYCGESDPETAKDARFYAAETLRNVMRENSYENAGWSRKMTGPGL